MAADACTHLSALPDWPLDVSTAALIPPQAIGQLLAQLGAGNEQERIVAAHTLAHLLETEEAKYRTLVGDPHANPNLRSHYAVGKLLSAIKVWRSSPAAG